ncbi:gluconate 2-dehydrogenase subunit 3 family protein [Agrobacterium tumefaciens]|uniref:gluconate 2-dehydrogenase subunit 3 family protein n=1 Tax=Agrobacterium tumefaciens TaxID=358 RepID=UPI0021CEBFC3|nr:gluconate 2-dehydrogenase subunit 3 family protein [Agrobacterium tumefaciens]UXS05456.1 gluconate 2-dehydrogenase subunit 3 family protein [Agrobacterium tumefaciens]
MGTKRPDTPSPSRRSLLKGFSLLPLSAAPLAAGTAVAQAQGTDEGYRPTFFNPAEWAFLIAACDRLIPHDEVGPGAVELGVPEFLDRHMQTPYANGSIWYMQGPFLEASTEFGYQGRLPLRDIIRVGIRETDEHCRTNLGGKSFAELAQAEQETLLKALEKGEVKFEAISSKTFFSYLLNEVRYGYFADPSHGGNKGMGSWKMIGYPGMRADYLDWVEVREKPYPIGPVDLAGRRG